MATSPEAPAKPPLSSNVYWGSGTKALTSPATSTSPSLSKTTTRSSIGRFHGLPGPVARRPLYPITKPSSKAASNPWLTRASGWVPSAPIKSSSLSANGTILTRLSATLLPAMGLPRTLFLRKFPGRFCGSGGVRAKCSI
ncbi:hypothetical protein ACFX2C_040723 [Malus domestica]